MYATTDTWYEYFGNVSWRQDGTFRKLTDSERATIKTNAQKYMSDSCRDFIRQVLENEHTLFGAKISSTNFDDLYDGLSSVNAYTTGGKNARMVNGSIYLPIANYRSTPGMSVPITNGDYNLLNDAAKRAVDNLAFNIYASSEAGADDTIHETVHSASSGGTVLDEPAEAAAALAIRGQKFVAPDGASKMETIFAASQIFDDRLRRACGMAGRELDEKTKSFIK